MDCTETTGVSVLDTTRLKQVEDRRGLRGRFKVREAVPMASVWIPRTFRSSSPRPVCADRAARRGRALECESSHEGYLAVGSALRVCRLPEASSPSATRVAGQFSFQQGLGKQRAGDSHKRSGTAVARLVNQPRQQLLPRATLSCYQDFHVPTSDLPCPVLQTPQTRRVPTKISFVSLARLAGARASTRSAASFNGSKQTWVTRSSHAPSGMARTASGTAASAVRKITRGSGDPPARFLRIL